MKKTKIDQNLRNGKKKLLIKYGVVSSVPRMVNEIQKNMTKDNFLFPKPRTS